MKNQMTQIYMNIFLSDFQPKPYASTSKVQETEKDDSVGTETCEFCKKSFEPEMNHQVQKDVEL